MKTALTALFTASCMLAALSASAQTILIDFDDGIANGIHDLEIRNGGFEGDLVSGGVATDRLTFDEEISGPWVNIAGPQTDDFVRTNQELNSDQNAVIADAATRIAGIDVGHSLALGDTFDFSYFWRDAFNWVDGSDRVGFTFFTTSDDTLAGPIDNTFQFLSGLSSANNTYQQETGQFINTDPAITGKNLFVSFQGVDGGGGPDGFGRIDDIFLQVTAAPPTTFLWTGAASGSWNTGANWDSDPAVPDAATADVLFASAAAPLTATVDTSVTVNTLSFSGANAFTVATAGVETLTLADSAAAAGDAAISVTDSTHEISGSLAGSVGFEKTGAGALRLSGDNSALSGGITLTEGDVFATQASALGGNAIAAADGTFLYLEGNAGAGFSGSFTNTVTGAGELRFGENATTEVITVDGDLSGVTGPMAVRGGVTVFNDASDFGSSGDTGDVRTYINQGTGQAQIDGSGGNLTIAESFNIGSRGDTTEAHLANTAGDNVITGDLAGQNGAANHVISAAAGSSLTFNNTALDPSELTANGTLVFQGAGDVVVGDAVGTTVASGAITGGANVLKQDSGTLTIATRGDATQSWTGTTVIEGGSLEVLAAPGDLGELASSSIAVRSGATFDVDNFAQYTVQPGQTISGTGTIQAQDLRIVEVASVSPGDSVGTLTVNGSMTVQNVAFAGDAGAFTYELGDTAATVGGAENDLIAVNGSLNLLSGPQQINVVPVESDLSGTYTAITSTGISGDASTVFSVAITDEQGNALDTRETLAASNSGNNVVLTVSGTEETRTWAGIDGDGDWDLAISTAWVEGDQIYRDLDDVVFGDVATITDGLNTVNIVGNTNNSAVTPGSVTVATSNDYEFTGDGIRGAIGLTKSGTGTATLANTGNSFTGGIDIQAGAVTLAGDATTISGVINIADGATLNVGAVANGNGNNVLTDTGGGVTINTNSTGIINVNDSEQISAVSGSGTINVQDEQPGFLANPSFSGNFVVSGGTAEILDADGLGDTVGTTTVTDGGRLFVDDSVATDINSTETLFIGGLGSDSAPDGNGALQVGGDATHTFAGAITLTSDTEFRTGNAAGTMNVTGSVDGSGVGAGLRLSTVGTMNISAPVTLGSGGLQKSSGGTATLSGAVSYSGDTTIEGGTLALTGPASLGTSANITVNEGATLDVSGTTTGDLTLVGQTLNNNSSTTVVGDINATAGSTITGDGVFDNNVTVTSSTVSIGDVAIGQQSGSLTGLFSVGTAGSTYTDANNPSGAPTYSFDANFTDPTTGATFDAELILTAAGGDGNISSIGGTRSAGVTGANGAISQAGESLTLTVGTTSLTGGLTGTLTFDGFAGAALFFTSNDSDAGQLTDGVTTLWNFDGALGVDGGAATTGNSSDDGAFTWDGTATQNHADVDLNALTPALGSLPATLVAEWQANTVAGDNRWRVDDVIGAFSFTLDATSKSLTVNGDYSQDALSTLAIDIASTTANDSLIVLGAADLEGLVDVTLTDGFLPTINDSWTILTAGTSLDITGLTATSGYSLSTLGNDLILTFVGAAANLAGDFNGDGMVDSGDYAFWRNNLGVGVELAGTGDGSGILDAADLSFWVNNFGATSPGAAGAAAVPEPGSLAIVLACGLGFLGRRRR